MTHGPLICDLTSRALLRIGGEAWRGFLQGLLTQDVESLQPGELRFGALLTPQGRLLFDLFIVGDEDGCLLDVEAQGRETLMQRLAIYRLRAKVTIASDETPVRALWDAEDAPDGWRRDPRLPGLGFRGYGAPGAANASEADYDRHRLALGVPGPADWAGEQTFPIEADFDLLAGIDFKKGCFVGQETTSRMKRRGAIKRRMLPIAFEGPAPAPGAELLAGTLRAGEALSGADGAAIALVRLDRLVGPLTLADGRPFRAIRPDWMAD